MPVGGDPICARSGTPHVKAPARRCRNVPVPLFLSILSDGALLGPLSPPDLKPRSSGPDLVTPQPANTVSLAANGWPDPRHFDQASEWPPRRAH